MLRYLPITMTIKFKKKDIKENNKEAMDEKEKFCM